MAERMKSAHAGRAIRPCAACTAPTTRRWCSRECAETWRRYADDQREQAGVTR